MNDPEFDPQEQAVINRLANAPQPTLNPAAFEMIRAQMLDAMDAPPQIKPMRRVWSRPPVIAAVAVTVVLASFVIILVSNLSGVSPTPTSPPTSPPTFTIVPPTTVPTAVTITKAPPMTSSVEPTVTVTATLEPVIVVEGPVESIVDNIITVYGIEITVDPDDPILSSIQIGDVLHIEADYATDTTTIVAVTVEPVPPTPGGGEVNVNPSTGEAWRDNGNCDNPPPPWAPANGWRRRCEAAPASSNPPGNSNGNGNAGGNGNGNGNGAGGNGNGNGKGNGNGNNG